MTDYSELSDDELELLAQERAEAMGAQLATERTEDGDWRVMVRGKDGGESIFVAETAFKRDALIGLLDQAEA